MFGLRWRRFWAWPWELRRKGVLGMNARNLELVSLLNPPAYFHRVDDKVLTKQICEARGLPVPRTYAILVRFGDVRLFPKIIGNRQQFVLKPACGAGGRGVVVVVRHDGADFHTSSGEVVSLPELRYHLFTTLSGAYSLGGGADRAIIEERITKHPAFGELAFGGTPDIRTIVFRHRPVMAMLRLPTKQSRGRANLHQGAVGVGIHMQTGRTTWAVCQERLVARHPDCGLAVTGFQIPFWNDVLTIAAEVSRSLEMGYIGVDIVLDASRGPIVLEANARPGLGIQVANQTGLIEQLDLAAQAGAPAPPQAVADKVCEPVVSQAGGGTGWNKEGNP